MSFSVNREVFSGFQNNAPKIDENVLTPPPPESNAFKRKFEALQEDLSTDLSDVLKHCDIKHIIFPQLRRKEILSLASVSKIYQLIAKKELIERINEGKIIYEKTIVTKYETCTSTQFIPLKVSDIVKYFNQNCHDITRLDLSDNSFKWIRTSYGRYRKLTDNDIKMISENCPKLEYLALNRDEISNESVNYFKKMTSIKEFKINFNPSEDFFIDCLDCFNFDDFSFFQEWPKLTRLCIKSFKDLNFLKWCPSLTSLSLMNCDFESISLEPHSTLTDMNLEDCNFKNLNFLKQFPSLTSLTLWNCNELRDLSFLKWCPHLKNLKILGCEKIDNTHFFQHCPQLTYLKMEANDEIKDISSLKHCVLLEELDLHDSENIVDLSFLEMCGRSLKTLHLTAEDARDIVDITPLKFCSELKYLYLGNCYLITDISALATLTKLEYLDCSLLPITDITPLKSCKVLKFLDLTLCENIVDISSLPFSIEEIILIRCIGIQDISSLQYCDSLKKITLSRSKFKEENTKLIKTYLREEIEIEFVYRNEEDDYIAPLTIAKPREQVNLRPH